jgi:hypothetical protein
MGMVCIGETEERDSIQQSVITWLRKIFDEKHFSDHVINKIIEKFVKSYLIYLKVLIFIYSYIHGFFKGTANCSNNTV